MFQHKLTNILLFLILLALVIDLIARLIPPAVTAETFYVDNCITSAKGAKPLAYLHVVSHEPAADDAPSKSKGQAPFK